MLRLLPFLAILLFGLPMTVQAEESCPYDLPAPLNFKIGVAPVKLSRGVNLPRWWADYPGREHIGEDISSVRKLGFDFVRLPVHETWLTLADEGDRGKKHADLRCDILGILNQGLNVILDFHPGAEWQTRFADDLEGYMARTESVWKQLQPVLADLPPQRVLLGLYNEPPVETFIWWPRQGRLIERLRKIFPDNTFVVATGPHSGWWELVLMKPYKDKNLLYDFHFYDPMIITHHGAEWLPDWRDRTPVVYPVDQKFDFDMGNKNIKKYVERGWSRDSLFDIIERVSEWRSRYKVNVICSEFGVYRPYLDAQSRYNWLRDTREALEDSDIPWALWEYQGQFGLLDPARNLDKGMADALGLRHSDSP